ncbi:SPFH domain-containing protein [Protaetiibacter intestinalis]|nr:SPFH domain-containing protein [Protaetiibacter intestinalis]
MTTIRLVDTGLRVTVKPWELAVVDREGVIARTVGPGRHRRRRRETWRMLDTRARWLPLATQDVLTSDGMQVRLTPVVRYRVVEPVAWLTQADIPADAVYVLAQLAVREAVAGRTLDEVLASRADVLAGVRERLTVAVAALGAEVLDFDVRDVTLSAELRHAFAETALAREQGRAKLERARADAAALRSLANVAQVLEAHPSLLQLRTLEAAAAGGHFIVRVGDAGPVVVE